MLDFGWAELLIIVAVGVFILGPKEIPVVMRTLGRFMRRIQYMKYALSRQFDEYVGDDFSNAVNFEAARAKQPEGHDAFDEEAGDADYAELSSLDHVINTSKDLSQKDALDQIIEKKGKSNE
ncbi:MAG: twin-arginine translocase TatA/TatE family subunit [Micavibrio sp.]|nr:twin-arginine translocase TatA/TatE family subunit [Micavibrio sp.]